MCSFKPTYKARTKSSWKCQTRVLCCLENEKTRIDRSSMVKCLGSYTLLGLRFVRQFWGLWFGSRLKRMYSKATHRICRQHCAFSQQPGKQTRRFLLRLSRVQIHRTFQTLEWSWMILNLYEYVWIIHLLKTLWFLPASSGLTADFRTKRRPWAKMTAQCLVI